MTKHKKNTRSRQKALYRVRNWSAYDRALVNRGSLTIWISAEAIVQWETEEPRQRGAQKKYSDLAIKTVLTIKEVFHLTNRQTEGFLRSVFILMGIGLPVPGHTTLSRRGKGLAVKIPRRRKTGSLHIVVDSTGLKIYGEGEWKIRKHGKSKRRTWRKLHLAVDAESGEIQAGCLSTVSVSDGQAMPMLLAQIDQDMDSFSGDGAYDKRPVYQSVQQHSPISQILEKGFQLPSPFIGRNGYVPYQNHLRRPFEHSSDGDPDHSGSHPLPGAQPHDPTGMPDSYPLA